MVNGKVKNTLIAVGIAVPLIAMAVGGYYHQRVTMAEELGRRPTRKEMMEAIDKSQQQTQIQLNDIKNRQEKTYGEIRDMNNLIRDYLMERRHWEDR